MPNPVHPKTIRFLGRRLRLKDGAEPTCAEWVDSAIWVELVVGRRQQYLAEFNVIAVLEFSVCVCVRGRTLEELEAKFRREMQRTLLRITRAIKAVDRG